MRMQNAECRVQSYRKRGEARVALLILHSALISLVSCTPITTRPPFLPSPQALSAVLDAAPANVVPEAVAWLTNQGVPVERSSQRDAYVETAWYNLRTKAARRGESDPGDLLQTIKIRCWTDPNAPGKSQLIVEVVYRPVMDPSRQERDLEVVVPTGSEGHQIAEQLVEAMKQKFGQ